MDKTDLLISFADQVQQIYDNMVDCPEFDPTEVEHLLELLKTFIEEVQVLVE